MNLKISFQGLPEFRERVLQICDATRQEAAAALYQEAEILMTEAKDRTPWETGVLRGTGHVQEPTYSAGEVRVELGFGGPAAPYAIFVHENLTARHPRGGRAKFLESVLDEAAPTLAERIAARIHLSGR